MCMKSLKLIKNFYGLVLYKWMSLNLVAPRTLFRRGIRAKGVTFSWYQSHGLVGSRTTIARMSLAIHAIMLMFKRVMTSDG